MFRNALSPPQKKKGEESIMERKKKGSWVDITII